jgi:hypothetical protein
VAAEVLRHAQEVAAENAQVGQGHVGAGDEVVQRFLEFGTVYRRATLQGSTPVLLGAELDGEALDPRVGQVTGNLGAVGAGVLDSRAAFVGEERSGRVGRADTLFGGLGGLVDGVAGRRFSNAIFFGLGGGDDEIDPVAPSKLGLKAVDDEGAKLRILVMSAPLPRSRLTLLWSRM